jgi:hypothetical protein
VYVCDGGDRATAAASAMRGRELRQAAAPRWQPSGPSSSSSRPGSWQGTRPTPGTAATEHGEGLLVATRCSPCLEGPGSHL